MKNTVGFIVLVVICLALGVTLIVRSKQSADQRTKDESTILYHSNQWQKTQSDLSDVQQVNRALESQLNERKADITKLTNELGQTTATLAKTEETLKSTQEEVAKRDAKINELESQNEALDKQAIDLNFAITNLNTQIADTQKKLATSEGEKGFLQKELSRGID